MQPQDSQTQPLNTLGLSFSELRAMRRQQLLDTMKSFESLPDTERRPAQVGLGSDLLKIGRYMEVLAAQMAEALNAHVREQKD